MKNDKTSRYAFFIFLATAVVLIVGYRFDRYYVAQDYLVDVFTQCDTTSHSCFEADETIADPAFQGAPYEKIEILARDTPKCLEEHVCKDFSCDGIASCAVTYCSSESLEDGESCTTDQPTETQTEPAISQ
jgi:hypothetical protein